QVNRRGLVMRRRHGKRSREQIASDDTMARILLDLANLRDDGIARFRNDWNKYFSRYSNESLLTRRDELRLLWSHHLSRLPPNFTDEDFESAKGPVVTERTRDLYESSDHVSQRLEEFICERWLYMERGRGWVVRWEPGAKRISANARCLPVLMAAGCVTLGNRLGLCGNPDCPAPFFLLARRDQRYCTDECAKPSKRAAKLKWWREHRGRQAGRELVRSDRR